MTIKELEKQMDNLKSINEFHITENIRLNKEIANMKNKENMVPKIEFQALVEQLEHQKQITVEYERLYELLKDKYTKEKNELVGKIALLQQQIGSSEIKLNARNAGRKPYSDEKVIDKIYSLYLSGKSLQEVAVELNSSGIKTNRNKDWSKSSIRFILLNEKNVLNGFIEEEIFNRAIKLLNHNKK